jgi:hypothetical protein
MYSDKKRYLKNGYVVVEYPEHHKSFDTGSGIIGVYEHVLIAEEILDRPIKNGEVVHHLDSNRSNNSPDNLLVMSNPMHTKLHNWMNKNNIIPSPEYQQRKDLGCVRCLACSKPIDFNMSYCSQECVAKHSEHRHKYEHPTKEQLKDLVWSMPTTKVAQHFNVSDKAIEKLCKSLGVDKPPRGYWTKKKFE